MAAVLDALAPFVKKLVKDMAEEEVSKLLGVSGEITRLDGTMESLRALVSDAESRRITEPSVQKWVNKLKNAMYDATDIMELCQLEADERRELEEVGEGGNREQNLLACFQPLLVWLQSPVVTLITCGGVEKMQGFFHKFLFCLRNPVFADEIGNRIKELNQRLEGIYKEADKEFEFHRNLGSSNIEPRKLTTEELSSYKTISRVDESAIVGEQIERDTKELVQVLTTDDDKNHDLKVVSINGTGGMGKTTLAQKIFNDATIQEHFKTKIWLSITKQFDEGELLRTAIKHAGGNHGGEQDKSSLTDTLVNTLSTKGRFLLVMDDVWSQKVWNDVLSVPVRNSCKKQPGSRVLVTTRDAHLPLRMQAALHQHLVRPLGNDDAWSLLKKQLQPDQVVGIDQLKTIGLQILENCDGLPLAIKVIGGLLSTRHPSELYWKAILSMPAWSLAGLPKELNNALYLSYEDLSPQVKQCFLYCSLFPKGETIMMNTVTAMWISEGFIKTPDESMTSSREYGLEEIAIEYYRELIKRNLIELKPEYSLTGYGCTMHDVVRSFAEYMVKEESMVMVGQEQSTTDVSGGMLLRRLAVGQTVSTVEWDILQRHKSLRALIIYSSVSFHHGGSLGSFSSLRTLHICSADFDSLVSTLSMLKHLRYLYLAKTDISSLTDDIHKMKFLLYISLVNCEKLCHLPSSIIKLVDLRFLNIQRSNVSVVPKGFGELTNLRSLYGFPVHVDMDASSSWSTLQELAPLSQLRELELVGLEKVQDSRNAEMAMINNKRHLWYLELKYSASMEVSAGGEAELHPQQIVAEEVLEKLCPPTCLENLGVRGGYIGQQLPSWLHAPASKDFMSLRFLALQNLPYCTQLPDGLCCLPSLELLDIVDAPAIKRIGSQFQAPSTSGAGAYTARTSAPFPKLRRMYLHGLSDCEEWEWNDCEEDRNVESTAIAMPCLEKLHINNCKLSCLPQGLASSKRYALRQLGLYKLTNITAVENFPSVVELDVYDCPQLKRISCLPMLQKIRIVCCSKLEVLEGLPALDSLLLKDATIETLPEYLRAVNPRYLGLYCNRKLCESFLSPDCSEMKKIRHIGKIVINVSGES